MYTNSLRFTTLSDIFTLNEKKKEIEGDLIFDAQVSLKVVGKHSYRTHIEQSVVENVTQIRE